MTPVLAAYRIAPEMATGLIERLGTKPLEFTMRTFPDGEHYVRVDAPVLGHIALVAVDLAHPDEKLLPTLLLSDTLRDLGADQVGLVAPYLPYMRQDKRFNPGEGVTSRYFAGILSKHFDWLVTVDPHLHRYGSLWDIYGIRNAVVHAAAPIARWISANVTDPVLVGPDSESRQWVEETARVAGLPYVVFEKVRAGDRDVKIAAANVEGWRTRTPVLIDDIISTGTTLAETVHILKAQGLKSPVCCAVHGLFAGDAYPMLRAAGAARIVTCNTVPHETNAIDLTAEIAEGVLRVLR